MGKDSGFKTRKKMKKWHGFHLWNKEPQQESRLHEHHCTRGWGWSEQHLGPLLLCLQVSFSQMNWSRLSMATGIQSTKSLLIQGSDTCSFGSPRGALAPWDLLKSKLKWLLVWCVERASSLVGQVDSPKTLCVSSLCVLCTRPFVANLGWDPQARTTIRNIPFK